jgi:hypothetical protein
MSFEDAGTFLEGGIGRGDIIDEPDGCIGYIDRWVRLWWSPGESAVEIFEAFATVFGLGLWEGGAGTLEMLIEQCERKSGGEFLCEDMGDEGGLVEIAPAQTSIMQWDGDEIVWERKLGIA